MPGRTQQQARHQIDGDRFLVYTRRHRTARARKHSGRDTYKMISKKIDIHEAAFSGDLCTVRKLLDEQKSANDKDDVGRTPLHKASMNGWLEIVKLLLQNGAMASATDIAGCTPLHHAAANGYIAICRHLVESGNASLSAKTNKGHTPRYMARARGQTKMAAFISELENQMEGNTWLAS